MEKQREAAAAASASASASARRARRSGQLINHRFVRRASRDRRRRRTGRGRGRGRAGGRRAAGVAIESRVLRLSARALAGGERARLEQTQSEWMGSGVVQRVGCAL